MPGKKGSRSATRSETMKTKGLRNHAKPGSSLEIHTSVSKPDTHVLSVGFYLTNGRWPTYLELRQLILEDFRTVVKTKVAAARASITTAGKKLEDYPLPPPETTIEQAQNEF